MAKRPMLTGGSAMSDDQWPTKMKLSAVWTFIFSQALFAKQAKVHYIPKKAKLNIFHDCLDTHAILYYIPKVLTFIRRQRQRNIYLFLSEQGKLIYQITTLGGFLFSLPDPNWESSKFLPLPLYSVRLYIIKKLEKKKENLQEYCTLKTLNLWRVWIVAPIPKNQ